jgi:hypothetical protein
MGLVRMRRWIAAISLAVALAGGSGVAVAAPVAGASAGRGATAPAGPPRYYYESGINGRNDHLQTVIRATATGAVTAHVRCPGKPGSHIGLTGAVAPADNQAFFVVCEKSVWHATGPVVYWSRIYRFTVTKAGRISSYVAVRGGTVTGARIGGLAVTPNGSEIAAEVPPASHPLAANPPQKILIINTATGAHAVWHSPPAAPGTVRYEVGDISLTADGRGLVFLTQPHCVKGKGAPPCKVTGGEQVRELSHVRGGGLLSSARVILKQASLGRLSTTYINNAVVTPNGSTVLLTWLHPKGDQCTWSVIEVSAATGKETGVRYSVDTGTGFNYRLFSADPSRRYLLFDVGPSRGSVNGWIDNGHLVRLKPNGENVFSEAW